MEVLEEPLPGLLVIKPDVYEDDRGFFLEIWQKERYKEIGIEEEFVQDNWSRSSMGILRGLHYQIEQPQGKLVSVQRGEVFDVAVDLRKESQTFGAWYGNRINEHNNQQMYIPPGFAHGFYVLSEIVDFCYKCTDYYAPEYERCIKWNDKNLDIQWPLVENKKPILSEKDKNGISFTKIDDEAII